MNEQLKIIQDFIQQYVQFRQDERDILLKAVKNADKDFTISEFKLDRTEKVKRTTAILLEETIEELEQKRKAVEAQNKELEIESALERIRSRTLAMKDSNELADAAAILFDQLKQLGFLPQNARTYFAIIDKEKKAGIAWLTKADGTIRPGSHSVPFTTYKPLQQLYEAIEQQELLHIRDLSGDVLKDYLQFLSTLPHVQYDEALQQLINHPPQRLVFTDAIHLYGTVGIMAFERITDEAQKTLIRFAKVFEFTYTRFLDLQKAEAQAREAQIELGLERVRARTMAMHHSDELADTSSVLFQQIKELGFETWSCGFCIWSKDDYVETWMGADSGGLLPPMMIPYKKETTHHDIYKASLRGDIAHEKIWEGKALQKHYAYLRTIPSVATAIKVLEDSGLSLPTKQCYYVGFFKQGYLLLITKEPNAEVFDLTKRFARVFEQTYTRFLDLKLAEAQAREAQINLAVERVRAKALAMYKSEEILDVVFKLKEEVINLNIPNVVAATIHLIEKNGMHRMWDISSIEAIEGKLHLTMDFSFRLEETDPDLFIRRVWTDTEKYFLVTQDEKDLKRTIQWLKDNGRTKEAEETDEFIKATQLKKLYHPTIQLNNGRMCIDLLEAPSDEIESILTNMGGAFDLAYKRFEDLKNSEAQLREAQIEASLERVRASAMAMHHSTELSHVLSVLFEQFDVLGICPVYSQMSLVDLDTNTFIYRCTGKLGKRVMAEQTVAIDSLDIWKETAEKWKNSEPKSINELHFPKEVIPGLFELFKEIRSAIPAEALPYAEDFPDGLYVTEGNCQFGYMGFAHARKATAEEKDIVLKFATEFGRLYQRFLDLQTAEAQTREAKIEAAMEKVRSRAMAMQKPAELVEVAELLRTEMGLLGVEELETSSIYIHNEATQQTECWYAIQKENKLVSDHMTIELDDTWVGKQMLEFYRSGKKQTSIIMQGGARKEWMAYCAGRSKILTGFYGDVIPDRTYHLYKFSDGYMGAASPGDISSESWDLLKRATNVFSLAYTRFSDLQLAEAQAREAQIELGLERVRARTMGMQKSEELKVVIQVVYEQFVHLNILVEHAGFIVDYKARDDMHIWLADKHAVPAEVTIPYFDCAHWNSFIEAKEKGKDFFANHLSFEEKNKFYQDLFKLIPGLPEETLEYYFSCPGLAISTVLLENVGLYIENFSGIPYSDRENDTLMRFGNVFQQTYTRFLDLQKAEGQAREAEIELALERIRARTMAMQKSDELPEAANLLFLQVQALGMPAWSAGYCIWEENKKAITLWMSSEGVLQPPARAPLTEDPSFIHMREAYERGESFFVEEIGGEELVEHYKYMRTLPIVGEILDSIIETGHPLPTFQIFHLAYFSQGFLLFITYEPVPDAHEIFKRFGKVFDQTYTRFLDLQKAEAQAREATIEAALERVRAKTMAMHSSEDVSSATATMFTELEKLGIENFRGGITNIKTDHTQEVWSINNLAEGKVVSAIGIFNIDAHPFWQLIFKEWEKKKEFLHYYLAGKEKEDYINILNTTQNYLSQTIQQFPDVHFQVYYFNEGGVWTNSLQPHSEEDKQVMKRFTSVFSLTFRRYKDLQKAEAQAREARIEASLERVRSKTMAMHNSQDVADTVAAMFDELVKLGIETIRCGIGIMHEPMQMEVWTARKNENGKVELIIGRLNMIIHPLLQGMFEGWKNKETTFSYELRGDDLIKYFTALINSPEYPIKYDIASLPQKQFHNDFYFPEGALFAFSAEQLSAETSKIFKRFAGVFGQTYRRFLDLQKAEAQAREATIEAALERVRFHAMAMQNSEDVGTATATMFTELDKLGVETLRCGIVIGDDSAFMDVWSVTTTNNEKTIKGSGRIDMNATPLWQSINKSWKQKDDFLFYPMAGEEKNLYYKTISNQPDYSMSETITEMPDQFFQGYFFGEGVIWTFSLHPHSEADKLILKKFTAVFSLTFRRYLDLKQVEAQAKEAKIEAALEKVRGKAMAMHNSNDLSVTASMVFTELRKLGINSIRSGVGLLNKENRKVILYSATSSEEGDHLSLVGWAMLQDHAVLSEIYDCWIRHEDYFPVLKGELLKTYYEKILSSFAVPGSHYQQNLPDNALTDTNSGYEQHGHFLAFSEGFLYGWSEKPYTETEIRILDRFKIIIDLTFRRYMELQKSEANAREAVKQAALDRVRAEIASMRTVSDLERITPLIWNELTILGVPFIRCGVFIMDELQQLIHTFLSTPDGKAIAAFHIPYDTPGNIQQVLGHWRNKKNYIDHWDEAAFTEFAGTLVKQGVLASPEQYLKTLPRGGFYLHFLPFLQGMLYVGNTTQLGDEEIILIQHVAHAFSTAYARYEDFNKLEAAKQQVDRTLTDLKQAQTQLVQSEKMASLGELTAGIAHEIQNPLNFVNNFSEVNTELIEDLKGERSKVKGERNEQLEDEILNDLENNLQKIAHHGKRADAIVKGMLQHSRSSTNQKEPTDINKLADEYLRLCYHGLRAKDPFFNATIQTDFDESLEEINIIPQDIGRVLLNLYTNAFYAVNEKKRNTHLRHLAESEKEYEPVVNVTTKSTKLPSGSLGVLISVKDNGNGISQKVLDKIFQPFFTTKPTGQGTGLGLSLSYDIIKAHGGEIKVETKGSEGAEFLIQLPLKENL